MDSLTMDPRTQNEWNRVLTEPSSALLEQALERLVPHLIPIRFDYTMKRS